MLQNTLKCYLYREYLAVALMATTPLQALSKPQIQSLESIVVSASRSEQLLQDSTASLSVVHGRDLEQVSAVHISESLARVPGVWVSRGNGQEHLTAIRSPVLTGAGSCGAFMVAEDSVPVRAMGFCNVNQLFDINTEQAQRIEVLRGSGVSVHSSDALHGVINVISQPTSKIRESRLTLESGSNDYGRVKYSTSNSQGQHGYRFNFNGARDGGYKDDSGFDQQKLSVRHDFSHDQVSVNTLLSITHLNQQTAGFVVGKDAYKEDARKRENPNPEAFRDTESFRLQSHIEKKLNNNGIFMLRPYIRYADMAFLMHFLPGTPKEENGQRSFGMQSFYTRPLSDQLQLSQGVDMEYTQAFLQQSQENGFSSFPSGKQYDYEVDALLLAAFMSVDYQPQPMTNLHFGARYEWLEYRYDNLMIAGNTAEDGSVCINSFTGAIGCRYSRPEDSTDGFGNLSFNGSLKYQFNDSLTGLLRLALGFRAPQATEMYRLQNGQMQAQLDSEETNSVELSIRGKLKALDYSLTGFHMKKNNVIFQSSDRLNLDGGETEHQGFEYTASWQLNEQWDLAIAGTLARHRYTSNVSLFGALNPIELKGNDIDTAPRRMHTAQLGWQTDDNTRFELEWVAMGKYYTDIDNLHSYNGHNLFHFRMRQRITDNINISLRINNLANEDYAERADFSGFVGHRYFIGEPRSYYVGASLNF